MIFTDWAHTKIYASKEMLKELHDVLTDVIDEGFILESRTEENGSEYLFTDSWDTEHLFDEIEKASKEHPFEIIEIHYTHSGGGAYTQRESRFKNGEEVVDLEHFERTE